MTSPISVTPNYSAPGVIGSYDYGYDPASPGGSLLSNQLASGEETYDRRHILTNTGISLTSQLLRLTYFTARKSETTAQVRINSGTTAAAATPTLVRIGLYLIASNGDGTLVASVPNDTSLMSVANTGYTRSWSTPYAKISGQRYAVGVLLVSATTVPTICGGTMNAVNEPAASPRLSAAISGQTDLPASFTDASVLTTGSSPYAAVLP